MTSKNKKLYNVIERLPEEISNKVLEYIDYLTFFSGNNNAPEELIIKDKEDLKKKLKEGMQDFENGNVCSLNEAYSEVKEILE